MCNFYEDEYMPNFSQLPPNAIIRFTNRKYLKYLKDPSGFYSHDNGGNKAGLSRIMTHIGQTENQSFTSAAVCPKQEAYDILHAYGNSLLILDKSKIENCTYIFNGDFQDLSLKAYEDENKFINNIAWCKLSDTSFCQFITKRSKMAGETNINNSERLVGHYFECRIFRPIKIEDIKDIYVLTLSDKGKVGSFDKYLEAYEKSVDAFWD